MYRDRYDYGGPYKTFERADAALEDMFALGEVCEGEHPEIEPRKVRREGRVVTRYYVTLA